MSELQATLEFSVEIGKFYNIDLFQRGYYQVRTQLRSNPRIPVKIETSLPRNSECDLIFPACINNGVAISKTFQILYRAEDIAINDVIRFRVNTLVNSHRVEECLSRLELQLGLDLYFTDEEFGPETQEKIECVSQRVLRLHFSATKGIHHHVPVIFDYFHLSAVCVTVHGTLLALHPPIISVKQPRSSWLSKTADENTLETVLFGTRPVSDSKYEMNRRLQYAFNAHKYISNVLLSTYESLQKSMLALMKTLPTYQRIHIEQIHCHEKLDIMASVIQGLDNDEDILSTATSDFTQLCAENVILWTQYLELFTLNEDITRQLSKEHHSHRVRRLSEAFFTMDSPKSGAVACHDPSIHGHNEIVTLVRNSMYFQNLPPLSVECVELDGDCTSLPVIFEDVFTDNTEPAIVVDDLDKISLDMKIKSGTNKRDSRDNISISSSLSNENASPRTRQKLGKKIIQNIKPSHFKRPSYSIQQSSTSDVSKRGSVMLEKSSAPLVGYRTLDTHFTSGVELGTLSTNNCESPNTNSSKESLPDLLQNNTQNSVMSSPDLRLSTRKETTSYDCLEQQTKAVPTAEEAYMINGLIGEDLPDAMSALEDALLQTSMAGNHQGQGDGIKTNDLNVLADSISDALGEKETVEEDKNQTQNTTVNANKRKVTVMELLKEEYTRSVISTSDKSLVTTNTLSTQRSDSDSNLLTGSVTKSGRQQTMGISQSVPDLSKANKQTLVAPVADNTISFLTAKEDLRSKIRYSGVMYSDFPAQTSMCQYFYPTIPTSSSYNDDDDGVHLVICVHGLDGNNADLRLVKTYLDLANPGGRLEFLMSERNQPDTFADFDSMTTRLVGEILQYCELYSLEPTKVSFIGHSLGNIIIRSALSRPELAHLIPRMHTLLSLSGPHLGTLYNNSGLVNMGMWFMQKFKKSGSLLQLSLKDNLDPRQTFLYKLSQKPGLQHFKNVLLVSSMQDKYVPYHSTRMELCRAAVKDTSIYGTVYGEMVNNLLQPLVDKKELTMIRYDVFHALPNTANSLIGRAAHIAVLDSEIFIEKLVNVAISKYFK